MANQVAAHGFELTKALRECCEAESSDKLNPLALHNSIAWNLLQTSHTRY
jgi:hypothetical protein